MRTETVSILFERGSFSEESTAMTAYALAFHIGGLTFIALSRIVLQVFYAFQDTWRPFWVAFACMAINLALCYALAPYLSHGGIALANTISAVVQILLLAMLLNKHVQINFDGLTVRSLSLSAVATGVMGLGVYWLLYYFETSSMSGFTALLIPYGITLGSGVLLFVGTCMLTKHPDFWELWGIVKRKLGK